MTGKLKYLDKIIPILQILIAGFMVYGLYWSIMDQENFMVGEHEYIGEHAQPKFHLGFVQNQQIYFLIIICFFGGLLMLFNKAWGWIISICFWLSCLIFGLVYTLHMVFNSRASAWAFLVETSLCLPFFVFLNLKPVLQKYTIGKKHWIIVFVLMVIITFDLYGDRLF